MFYVVLMKVIHTHHYSEMTTCTAIQWWAIVSAQVPVLPTTVNTVHNPTPASQHLTEESSPALHQDLTTLSAASLDEVSPSTTMKG